MTGDSAASHPDDTPDVLRTGAAGGMVIRGGALRAGGFAVGTLIGAVTAVFLLRGLGTDDFGRYMTVAAVLGIVSAITDAGLTAVGARELAVRSPGRQREELMGTLLGLRILLTSIGVVAGSLFVWVAGYDSTLVAGTLLGGVGVLLVNTQATAMMPLSVELRVGTVTAFEVLKQALTLAGIAALAIAGAELIVYFGVQALVGAVALVAIVPFLPSARALVPSVDRSEARRLLRTAAPVALALALSVIYLRLMLILVSLVAGDRETGLYAASFRVFELLIGLPALLAVALPVLAVAGQGDKERLAYALQRMTEVAFLVASFVALVTAILAEPLIELVGGSEYSGAGEVLAIQVWALLGVFVGQVAVLGLLAVHRQREIAIGNGLALVLLLALGLILVPSHGAKGAAVATVVAEAVLASLLVTFVVCAEPRRLLRLGLLPRALVALGAAALTLFIPLGPWPRALLAAAVFLGVASLTRAVPPELLEALRPSAAVESRRR